VQEQELVQLIAERVLQRLKERDIEIHQVSRDRIPVGVSVRHLHITKEDFAALFGENAELKVRNWLYQEGEFASDQTVTLVTARRSLPGVRILGPFRSKTQVEVSRTDAIMLGVNPPVRVSVNEANGGSRITLVGPEGSINVDDGLIVARRHIHCSPAEATALGIKEGDKLDLEILSDRPVVLRGVVVRTGEKLKLQFHVDTDEANAADVRCDMFARIAEVR